ncbi:Glycoside Hydrolase Family 47 protein [Trametes cinnabarina]|uniref:alpha-1,2-Mannosidase n=1 Tax=Pycnoporus cinnabarinus TaxID=5643 RepID=A0A060S2N3_PYCCI|nr:Glycoside Hydrolase Family 47 protein [Trametes cinnabarina]
MSAQLQTYLSRRSRSVRYIAAACTAIFVVSTLYYLELPHYAGEFRFDEHLPQWPAPTPSQYPQDETSSHVWDTRAAQVKQAFRHAYQGYLEHANGFDELRPLSNVGVNNFNGWNVTMYDSLDTMLLMGLYDEFEAALPVVAQGNFTRLRSTPDTNPWSRSGYAPFFETVIRYLGGLLSAYALSGEKLLLDRASELATLLEPAFNPATGWELTYGWRAAVTPSQSGMLAEIASCQLEWTYAAHATVNKTHYDRVSDLLETLANAMEERKGGMFPTGWHLNTGKPVSESRSVGAAADSAHEYLLKQYLLTGKQQDIESLEMYMLTTNEVLTRLLYLTPNRELLYVTDTSGSKFAPAHRLEHLACFFPGLLALGAHAVDLNAAFAGIDRTKLNAEARRQYDLLSQYDVRALHMAAAEGLATSCWLMYADQPSGLGAEVVDMEHTVRDGSSKDAKGILWIDAVEGWRNKGRTGPLPGTDEKKPIPYTLSAKERAPKAPWDYVVKRHDYFLRPETIESIYIMWKTTGNPVWRERGWAIFEAIEREAKTPSGYASLKTVTQSPAPQSDDQPSYFLAETLKYLYLLFSNEDPVPLDKWVFNTEAHPLPVFTWSDYEKHKLGIPS